MLVLRVSASLSINGIASAIVSHKFSQVAKVPNRKKKKIGPDLKTHLVKW